MSSGRRQLFRRTLLLVGTLVTLCFLLFPLWGRRIMRPAMKRDHDEAAAQIGVATITFRVPARPDPTSGRASKARVQVRFQGQLRDAKEINEFDLLEEGQPAQIVYRIGKSGRLYVDSVSPLRNASAVNESVPPK